MNEELANQQVQAFIDAVKNLKDMDDNLFSDEALDTILQSIDQSFSKEQINQSVSQIIANLEAQGTTRAEAKESVKSLKEFVNQIVYGDQIIAGNKRKVVDKVVEKIYETFDTAYDKYHFYSIELPIMLEEGAQVPTYAHDSDAAADMYAFEDITIQPHTHGTPVKTGVHIQLPEGWVAFVLPRSSMGAKTPLRLSNSVGVIDSGYRGEVRAIYDNISDDPYEIHKGDRIAQMLVMPSYRFKANVVDSLTDSDRGEGGFGSTGT